jgi:hypothetical protein
MEQEEHHKKKPALVVGKKPNGMFRFKPQMASSNCMLRFQRICRTVVLMTLGGQGAVFGDEIHDAADAGDLARVRALSSKTKILHFLMPSAESA